MKINVTMSVANLFFGRTRKTMALRHAVETFCLESGNEGQRDREIAKVVGKLTELVLAQITDEQVKKDFLLYLLPHGAEFTIEE